MTEIAITEETKRALREWAVSKNAIASLWLFGSRAKGTHRASSDYDLAIELKPKKGDHDWAFGDYVCEYEEWKSAVREIVKADVSIVAFRDDLEGPFDPRDQGVKLWPKEIGQIAGHRARI
jgi:predicted nucleotidyltransferase